MTPRGPSKHLGRHDVDLVALTALGDRSAYGELVRRHAPVVRALLRRMGADVARADDMAQDAFITAFERISDFRGEGSFVGWLKRIAARLLLKQLKRDKGFVTMAQVPEPEAEILPPPRRGDLMDLDQALLSLSQVERVCVSLTYGAGLSHTEVSETLKVPLGTVKSHVRRGLQKLRVSMDALEAAQNLDAEPSARRFKDDEARGAPLSQNIGGLSHG